MKTQVTTLNTICVKKKMIYEMPFFIDDKTWLPQLSESNTEDQLIAVISGASFSQSRCDVDGDEHSGPGGCGSAPV